MAARTIAIKPAAGPVTLTFELLKLPTISPPIIPLMIPANGGAPLATAIPRQRGKATKNTTMPGSKSARLNFTFENIKKSLNQKKLQTLN
jgi:hypothetical protein